MKKLFAAMLSLFVALGAIAQTTISPSNSNICFGQSVTLVAHATGYDADTLNIQWLQNGVGFGMPNNDTITYTPAVGSWNITINVMTSGGQFVGTGFATVVVNSNPSGTASNTGPYCVGGNIQLQATGGTSYTWSGPNSFSSNAQNPNRPATTANAGTYTVTVTNANGCSSTTTTNVVVNNLPTPSITVSPNDTVCQGTTVALFATGGTSYGWNTGATTASITQTLNTVGNTIFNVQVTDANGCAAMTSQTITVRANPVVNATGTNVSCYGGNNGTATANATIGGPFTYVWNTLATAQTITGLTPAVYSVVVTNSFGCTATDTAAVGQPMVLTAGISSHTNVSCYGGSNGTATVIVTGGTAPYSYSWTGNGAGANPRTSLTAGTYTVTVSDANGCQATTSVTITQPLLMTANADSVAVHCNGGTDGIVLVTVIGGTQPYAFLWNNGATTNIVTNVSAGSYNVVVTDTNGCQAASATIVTQPSPIGLSALVTNVSCFAGNNGAIDLTVTGGTSPYTYLWSTGSTAQDPTGLINGQKTVTVTDAHGCTASTSWIVLQPTALTLTTNTNAATCAANGSASVSVSGGTPGYHYHWSSNNSDTLSFITASAATYHVTVTDANGCQALALATIAPAIQVAITDSITNVACYAGHTGAINLTVTGISPFTYVWSNGPTTQDLNGLGWGTYSVTVTAANSCTATATFTVAQPAPFTAQASGSDVLCYGANTGTATVMANGGTIPYSYHWSNGATTNPAISLTAGVYAVTVTDAHSCTVQATATVQQPVILTAVMSSQQNVSCFGANNGSATVSAAGGTGNLNYIWNTSPVQTGPTANNVVAGTYIVTVSDANGCTTTSTAIITSPSSPLLVQWDAIQNPCNGMNNGSITVIASGGSSPYSYHWNDGVNGQIRAGLWAGSYIVTVTDANGCTTALGQTLNANPGFTIGLAATVNYCVGSNILLQADVTGGTWPYGYQWQLPSWTTVSTSNGYEPTQGGIIRLIVVDDMGCVDTTYTNVNLQSCTGIEDVMNEENVKMFPNPISSGGTATIAMPNNIHEVIINILNPLGQNVFHAKTEGTNYYINTSDWAVGTYMVQIATNDQSITKKLVVQQ